MKWTWIAKLKNAINKNNKKKVMVAPNAPKQVSETTQLINGGSARPTQPSILPDHESDGEC
jgi:hypothetical protein